MTETKIEKIIFTFQGIENREGRWQIKFAEEVDYQGTKINGLILPEKNNWENFFELKKDEQFIVKVNENNYQIRETTEARFLSILDEKNFSWEEVDKIEEVEVAETSDSEATEVNSAETEKPRNIILIGRTGNGKSTLANVICGKENVFQEGKYSVSQTRDIQIEEFTDYKINYRIIDTMGIGDTKKTMREVLNKIADAAYEVRDGLHQILFVTRGKFTEEERETYNMIRRYIFDEEIVKYTTIVVTNFSNFEDEGECKKNERLMKAENEEMFEIMENCRRIIHVDNPPIDIGENVKRRGKKIADNRETREESRKILMVCLAACWEVYKPKNLDKLNEEVQNYVTEKERLQQVERQLEEMKNKLNEEQKRELEELRKKIFELEEKIAVLMQGFFERMGKSLGRDLDWAVGAVGEGIAKAAELTTAAAKKTVEVVGETFETIIVQPVNSLTDKCIVM